MGKIGELRKKLVEKNDLKERKEVRGEKEEMGGRRRRERERDGENPPDPVRVLSRCYTLTLCVADKTNYKG